MVKYSPKDNTYKEMYLINKFEKDIMESSLQNLSNSKKDMTEQYKSPITVNSDSDKESMQTVTKKTPPIPELHQKQLSNDGGVIHISENTDSIVNEDNPKNGTLAENGIPSETNTENKSSKNDSILTPSDFKRIQDAEKRAIRKIKSLTQNEKKRNELKKNKNKKVDKSPERRATRKMVKTNNKKKKLIIVKHATNPISITSLRNKKIGNGKEFTDQIFQNWRV